jgi:Glu-tRNA(Gln) amidotransferase subunit E-like FAD-binding protein
MTRNSSKFENFCLNFLKKFEKKIELNCKSTKITKIQMNMIMQIFKKTESVINYENKATEELVDIYAKQNKDREQIRALLYKRHYHDFYPYKMWNYSFLVSHK